MYSNLKPILTKNCVTCFIDDLDQSKPKYTGDPACTNSIDDGNFFIFLD